MDRPLNEVRLRVEFNGTVRVLSHLLQIEQELHRRGLKQLLVPTKDSENNPPLLLQPLFYAEIGSTEKPVRLAGLGLNTIEYIENYSVYTCFEDFFESFQEIYQPVLEITTGTYREMHLTYVDIFRKQLSKEIRFEFYQELLSKIFGKRGKSVEPLSTDPLIGIRLPMEEEGILEFLMNPTEEKETYSLRMTHITHPKDAETIKELAFNGRELIKSVFKRLISENLWEELYGPA